MKENDDKHLDDFAKKLIKKTALQSPSIHFTSKIMSQVSALHENRVTAYKPLISKKAGVLMALGFISLCAYLILNTKTQQSSWFSALDFNALLNNKLTNALSGFTMSKTVMYAVVFFGFMFCIQIPVLKHYFDKRLEM